MNPDIYIYIYIYIYTYVVLFSVTIIQICHASVGNMMECFPVGGKPSSRGEAFHHVTLTGMAYLFYYTEQIPFVIYKWERSQMTGDSHISR